MINDKYGIITMAFGNDRYFRMAKALGLSIRRYDDSFPLAVITDENKYGLNKIYDHIIPLDKNFGRGVSQKLYIDIYTPFKNTLYIDSDCLLYGSPHQLWGLYSSSEPFGVQASKFKTHGDSFPCISDLDQYLTYYGVRRIADLNGSIYYFEDADKSTEVFETARRIYSERNKFGLLSFKNSPVNDELVIAMALEVCGVKALSRENGKAMNTIYGQTRSLESIDVLEGRSKYVKDGTYTEPVAIHYGVGVQRSFIYLRELYRLELESYAPQITQMAGVCALLECLRDRVEVKYNPNRAESHKVKAVSWRDQNGVEVGEGLPAQILQCLISLL